MVTFCCSLLCVKSVLIYFIIIKYMICKHYPRTSVIRSIEYAFQPPVNTAQPFKTLSKTFFFRWIRSSAQNRVCDKIRVWKCLCGFQRYSPTLECSPTNSWTAANEGLWTCAVGWGRGEPLKLALPLGRSLPWTPPTQSHRNFGLDLPDICVWYVNSPGDISVIIQVCEVTCL